MTTPIPPKALALRVYADVAINDAERALCMALAVQGDVDRASWYGDKEVNAQLAGRSAPDTVPDEHIAVFRLRSMRHWAQRLAREGVVVVAGKARVEEARHVCKLQAEERLAGVHTTALYAGARLGGPQIDEEEFEALLAETEHASRARDAAIETIDTEHDAASRAA